MFFFHSVNIDTKPRFIREKTSMMVKWVYHTLISPSLTRVSLFSIIRSFDNIIYCNPDMLKNKNQEKKKKRKLEKISIFSFFSRNLLSLIPMFAFRTLWRTWRGRRWETGWTAPRTYSLRRRRYHLSINI